MELIIESETFDPDSHFLFWKPGSPPYVEPDGMALRLDKTTDLILNTHLQPSGKPELIQPTLGLYFTDKPATLHPILLQLGHDSELDIPPGDKNFLVSDDFTLPVDVSVLAIYPHAHYLGKDLLAYATLPDGSGDADSYQQLGFELAGRLSLRGTDGPARGNEDFDALHVRQLSGQHSKSQRPADTRHGGEPRGR